MGRDRCKMGDRTRVGPGSPPGARRRRWMVSMLALSVLLAACGATAPNSTSQLSPLATEQVEGRGISVLPTVTTPLPMEPERPAAAERLAIELVLLHTNDNWGETEPCG